MKSPKDHKHHHDVSSTHDSGMNRYFGGNETCKKSTCDDKKCTCNCTTCTTKKCTCKDKGCDCNESSEGHCCG